VPRPGARVRPHAGAGRRSGCESGRAWRRSPRRASAAPCDAAPRGADALRTAACWRAAADRAQTGIWRRTNVTRRDVRRRAKRETLAGISAGAGGRRPGDPLRFGEAVPSHVTPEPSSPGGAQFAHTCVGARAYGGDPGAHWIDTPESARSAGSFRARVRTGTLAGPRSTAWIQSSFKGSWRASYPCARSPVTSEIHRARDP
jgi:hypothetical protein